MTTSVASVQSLIENVRSLMRSDTATLLLLDQTGTVLEPAASAGLGRRWRGATHVPVGSGFAGQVAARREPVVLDEINETSVLNPILRDFGLRQLLGVPVLGADGLIGVLHVGWLMTRTFTAEDTGRLEGAAAEIGQRLSEGTERDAHLAALALQRSLLPAAPAAHRRSRHRGAVPARRGGPGRRLVRHLHASRRRGRHRDGRRRRTWPPVGGRHGPAAQRAACLRPRLRRPRRGAPPPRPQALLLRERHLGHRRLRGQPAPVRPRDDVQRGPPGTVGRPARAAPSPTSPTSLRASCWASTRISPVTARRSRSPRARPLRSTPTAWSSGDTAPDGADPDVARLQLVRRAFDAGDDAETACSRIIAGGLGDDSVEDDVALVVVRRPV